jgi:hypothetical protein
VDNLQERELEFSEPIKEGRLLSEAWWAAAGQKGIFMARTLTPRLTLAEPSRNLKDKQEVSSALLIRDYGDSALNGRLVECSVAAIEGVYTISE